MRIFKFDLPELSSVVFFSVFFGTLIFSSAFLNAQSSQNQQNAATSAANVQSSATSTRSSQTQSTTTRNAKVLQNSTTLEMLEMPSISVSSGPAMPTISTPTIGRKFYTPTINRSYETNSNSNAENYSASANSASSLKSSTNVKPFAATSSINSQEKASSARSFGLKSLSSALTSSGFGTSLSASDLLSMDSNGLFSNIYGLSGTNTNDIYSEPSETLLNNIISSLEEIKQEQEKINEKLAQENGTNQTSGNQSAIQSDSEIVTYKQNDQKNPSILRFSINGLNILDTCRTVYFSKKENDGSFLLTGDRKYYANGKIFTETFYFLFKSDGNSGANLGYDVQPAIIQNAENQNSFVYKLSQKKNLKAAKTGNLVTLHFSDSDLRTDLLLDIGEQK